MSLKYEPSSEPWNRRLSTSSGAAGVFIDNLLVRIHFIIVMIRWTGLAPREFEFPFPGDAGVVHLEDEPAALLRYNQPLFSGTPKT